MRSVVVISPEDNGSSPVAILDQMLTPQTVGLSVSVSAGASLTTKVQYSLDDPFAVYNTDYATDAVWYDHITDVAAITSLSGITSGNHAGRGVIPARAYKLVNSSWVSGTATLTVVQCGGIS